MAVYDIARLKGRKVTILADGKDILSEFSSASLLLSGRIQLNINNTYAPLIGMEQNGSTFLNQLASLTINGKSKFIVPSQTAIETMSVWKQGDPLKINLELTLHMINSAKQDVLLPALALIKRTLPTKFTRTGAENSNDDGRITKMGLLIPPGPNLRDVFKASNLEGIIFNVDNTDSDKGNLWKGSTGIFTIKIGEYLTLRNMVIPNIVPDFSEELDEDYCPISCSLSVEAQSIEVATTNMFESIIQAIGG